MLAALRGWTAIFSHGSLPKQALPNGTAYGARTAAIASRPLDASAPAAQEASFFASLQKQMPDLIEDMQEDFADFPRIREFVIIDRSQAHRGSNLFVYYTTDYPDLDKTLRLLSKHGLITRVVSDNARRYRVSDRFAQFLSQSPVSWGTR